MATRIAFGATELQVSPVCFGTWQLSPRFWGDQPENELLDAMRAAFDNGINFFDTADAYGDGLAETVMGKFFKDIPRDEAVICTKVFNHFNPDASRYPDLSDSYVRERCDIQLQRMGVETIDLYLLHFFDPLTPLAEITDTLKDLQKQGKIRHYGVSNFSTEQLRAVRKIGDYNAVQPPYSLLAPEGENDLLPYCEAENVGVMVYSPMHKGLLTGKYKGGETFSDFREHHPDFQGERFREICERVQDLSGMAEKYKLSLYQLILAATMMHPGIDAAVVGIKTEAQIREAAGAMGVALERPDYFAIRKALSMEVKRIKDATGGVR